MRKIILCFILTLASFSLVQAQRINIVNTTWVVRERFIEKGEKWQTIGNITFLKNGRLKGVSWDGEGSWWKLVGNRLTYSTRDGDEAWTVTIKGNTASGNGHGEAAAAPVPVSVRLKKVQ